MSKAFFDVFPTIHVQGELFDIFKSTDVSKVAWTRDHRKLRVYVESGHIISHGFIREMEGLLTQNVCAGTDVKVVLVERYMLSSQYTVQILMSEYIDSLTAELWEQSPVLGTFFKTASFEYPDENQMILHLEKSVFTREGGEKICKWLTQILFERCGMDCRVTAAYDLTHHKHAKSVLDTAQVQKSQIPMTYAAAEEPEDDSYEEFSEDDNEDYGEVEDEDPEIIEADAVRQNERRRQEAAYSNYAGSIKESKTQQIVQSVTQPSANESRNKSEQFDHRRKAESDDDQSNRIMRGFIRSNNPDVICGREFKDDTIPISNIVGEIGEVVIHGKIISNERRDIRNNKSILKFTLTDFTDSIIVKIFAPTAVAEQTMDRLSVGNFVKVKGFAREDSFEHETTVGSLTGIMAISSFVKMRQDTYDRKRVELHMHTKMSDMDGVSECKALVKRAYDWGWPAVAITDHGTVQAFPDANHLVEKLYDEDCKAKAAKGLPPKDRQDFFKVIYGVECYLVDDFKKMVTLGDTDHDPAFSELVEGESALDYKIHEGRYVIFDLETTGLSSEKNKIIEIGALKYENGKETGKFSEFVNPKVPIPYKITELTSITDETVMQAETIDVVLPKFIEFCKGCILVGHNVEFDISFIRKNASDLGIPAPFTTIDTIGMARAMLPGHNSYSLDAVGKMLKVENPHHHRAIDDAWTTAQIFTKLLQLLRDKCISTLGEMNALEDSNTDVIKRLRPHHCVLLAKNTTGRTNLYRLISASHLTYFFQYPKVPKSLLQQYREGLIVGSACVEGELQDAILSGKDEKTLAEIVSFYDYLEIQPRANNAFLIEDNEHYADITSEEDLLDINRKIVKLGKQYGKPVVATGDAHFLDPEDRIYRSIILDSKGRKKGKDSANAESAPLYLHTTDEMMQEFSYLGADKCEEVVITNPNKIASWVDVISPVRPDKCPPVIKNSDQTLREICYRQAHKMYGDPLPQVVSERLERELTSIIKNGYSVMYIIAQKLVWKSNEDGYLVGSRGSVGSSFVATMAGITEVNPLPPHYYCPKCQYSDFDSDLVKSYAGKCGPDLPDKRCPHCGAKLMKAGFDIPFETFLGFKGDKEPDIDLNFSGEYQAKAHAYTKVIFGHEQTFKAGTIATVKDKIAYGYTYGYFNRRGITKRRCELERLSQGCIGVRRSTGQHPGGIVVLPIGEDINTFTPVQHPANDMTTDIVTTHFDYHSIDHNLLKLDILGHDDPTMIRMLQDLTGVDPISLPLDDPEVMALFRGLDSLGLTPETDYGIKVGTLGVPEFGTKFVMGMLESTRPTTLSELLKVSGLSHGTDVYLGNAADLIANGTCTLATCIGCRDDIMTYLISMGLDPSEAFKIMENVRKGKVAKGECKQWPEWKEDMKSHGVPDWYMESCQKIRYMFPKGHAAAYVMMALRIAWFKVHRPLAYYAAYYTIRAKAFDYEIMAQGKNHLLEEMKRLEVRDDLSSAEEEILEDALVVREMYARGIEFTPIRLGVAKGRAFQIVDGKIMPSYTALHGMGASAADSLEEACRKGEFTSIQDIKERGKVSQTILDSMNKLGIIGDLPETDQLSLFDFLK